MKNKSVFTQILLLIIMSLVCIAITIGFAFFAGSYQVDMFSFENLNFSNMIPVLVIGGFISCVIVGITVLFIGKSVFIKIKDYLSEEKSGGCKK